MLQLKTVVDRILEAVRLAPACQLDDLVLSLPGLTWNQVFLEIDRLSRQGQVLVTFATGGRYMIRLPDHKAESVTH